MLNLVVRKETARVKRLIEKDVRGLHLTAAFTCSTEFVVFRVLCSVFTDLRSCHTLTRLIPVHLHFACCTVRMKVCFPVKSIDTSRSEFVPIFSFYCVNLLSRQRKDY